MNDITAITSAAGRPRRRPQAKRPADLFDALRADEEAARRLADDLAALVAAGLITPVGHSA